MTATAAPAGVYQVWGTDAAALSTPYVRGGQIMLNWKDIEPSRGTFAWSGLRSKMAAYAQGGKPFTVQVNSTTKPTWIYNHGVAKCGTHSGDTVIGAQDIPRYWDADYMDMMREMINALATELKASPHRGLVLAVRTSPNLYGTEHFVLPSTGMAEACNDWTMAIGIKAYADVMRMYRNALLPEIVPIIRADVLSRDTSLQSELLGTNSWLFSTNSSADDVDNTGAWDAMCLSWCRSGRTSGYWEPWQHSNYWTNPHSWNYWRVLMELHKGVSYIAVYGKDISDASDGDADDAEYRAAFEFANRYAGFHSKPATSPGAWIALRKGTRTNLGGNYGWFLSQLNADTTSVSLNSNAGSSMIGPAAQRFGREARRTDAATGKKTMSFRLADPITSSTAFRSSLAGTNRISITYLDSGTATFTVVWGTDSGEKRTITRTNTGRWVTTTFAVNVDATVFKGGLANAADFTITANGTTTASNLTLHMIEVLRGA